MHAGSLLVFFFHFCYQVIINPNRNSATLGNKLRSLLRSSSRKKPMTIPELGQFFGSFKNLLKDHHHAQHQQQSTTQNNSEQLASTDAAALVEEPHIGFPPKLHHLSATALGSLEDAEDLPTLWRVANLIMRKFCKLIRVSLTWIGPWCTRQNRPKKRERSVGFRQLCK